MGFKEKIEGFFYSEDSVDTEDAGYTEAVVPTSQYENQLEEQLRINSNTKLVLFEPRVFDEVEEAAAQIKDKRATVINLHRLENKDIRRMIDFMTGVVFALDGDIQKIGEHVLLCTPASFGVSGKISESENETK